MAITFKKYIKDIKEWVQVYRKGSIWQDPSGDEFELFSIKTFAEAVGSSPASVKIWEKKGLIPPPLFYVQTKVSRDRKYSSVQIINCHRIFFVKYRGNMYSISLNKKFEDFSLDVKKIWYCKDLVVNEKGEISV